MAKSTKTETAPQPAAKTEVAKDKFGCREGSQAAAINAAMSTTAKTPDEVAEKLKLTVSRVRSHMKFLVGKGHATEADGSYALKKTK